MIPPVGRSSERGNALFIALATLSVMGGTALLMLSAVRDESMDVDTTLNRVQALKMSEGLLEVAEGGVSTLVSNFRPYPAAPAGDPFLLLTGTSVLHQIEGQWTVHEGTTLQGGGPVAVPPSNHVDPQTGLASIIIPLELRSQVSYRTSRVGMTQFTEMVKTPIFQFMAFYDSDLEIHPGPQMTIDGRVHSNGDIYFGANTSLSIDTNYVRTSGDLYRGRKNSNEIQTGWIKIRNSQTGVLETLPSKSDLQALGVPSEGGIDSRFLGFDINSDNQFNLPGEIAPFMHSAESLFGGTLRTSEHGVRPMGYPEVGSIQAYVEVGTSGGDHVQGPGGTYIPVPAGSGTHNRGYYHEQAQLIILDDRVFDGLGNDITAQMPAGFLTMRSMYDAREGGTTLITEVNLGRLGDMDGNPNTFDPSPHYPANGLVFASRSDTSPGDPTGIVLSNGSQLNVPDRWNLSNYQGAGAPYAGQTPPPGAYTFGSAEYVGLTVVTPNPAYVHGDFNTISKKPAAVIADTVNLLSNSWNYSKTSGSLPSASHTTFNLAMITGNQVSGSGYNGGFENLPRFHENWTGRNCNIVGSFVNIWRSQQATGTWVYGGNRYTAPNRNWSFDQDFDSGKLPPFTPMVIDFRTVAIEIHN
jgi:hypothetical protein